MLDLDTRAMADVENDYELAFQIQMKYVLAASLGIGMTEDVVKAEACTSSEGELTEVVADQETEEWQKEEGGRLAAIYEAKLEGQKLMQIQKDRLLAEANVHNSMPFLISIGNSLQHSQSDEQWLRIYLEREDAVCQSSKRETCVLCAENRNEKDMVTLPECRHRFCSYCVQKYCEINIEEGKMLVCPEINCGREMATEEVCGFISLKHMKFFYKNMVEWVIPAKERVYCPYKDCSALMSRPLGEGAQRSDCVECKRPFCLECRVPWHHDLSCRAFQKLPAQLQDQDGAKFFVLSQSKHWRQCPRCGYFIELVAGCNHMTCRCKFQFCFNCGQDWTNHKKCPCDAWKESNIFY